MELVREEALLRRKAGPSQTAQSVVEFAITLPVLLVLVLGLINLGLLVNAQVILTQAAWEGARAGATVADPARGDAEIVAAVKGAVTGLNPDSVRIEIDPRQDEPPRNQPWPMPRGNPLTVRLEYDLNLSLPLTLQVAVRASAVSRIEYQNP
jgi:hypothetical protein